MRDFLRLLDPKGWAALGAVILLLVAALFFLGRCSRSDDVKDATNAKLQGDARTASAVEAITEIGKLDDRGQATTQEVQDAQEAIRQAPPADRDRVARARLRCLQHPAECDRVQ